MEITARYYLFATDGLKRLSRRLLDGLISGNDALPQYAGTKQRVAQILIEADGRKLHRITDAIGSFFGFDAAGKIDRELRSGAIRAMETHDALLRSQRRADGVVDLMPKLKRKRWEDENRWELSAEDLDLVSSDIFGPKAGRVAELAVGAAPVRPPLTSDAETALFEIQGKVTDIELKIDRLSEKALKGFAFEARTRASDGQLIWNGVADAADRRREILKRHRTGKGVWFAVIELCRHNPSKSYGEMSVLAQQKCSSLKEAEEAARKLLAEHAHHFSEQCSVEAGVYTELEWSEEEQVLR